ncbi:MAG: hypothetical protein ACLFQV_02945 [Vulcanimicrobiota bacterium]
MSSEAKIICPICEFLNSHKQINCKQCGQDLRSAPLQDYLVFLDHSFELKKIDLTFQLGVLKHKINIFFDSFKYITRNLAYGKLPPLVEYYSNEIERQKSSIIYYLMLINERIFRTLSSLLEMDFRAYLRMLKTFSELMSLTGETTGDMDENNLSIIEQQKNRLINTIDEIIIELTELESGEASKFEFPPPPIIQNFDSNTI